MNMPKSQSLIFSRLQYFPYLVYVRKVKRENNPTTSPPHRKRGTRYEQSVMDLFLFQLGQRIGRLH